ncbi:MAG: hypothetical protein RL398_3398 [Planctomycetota bacterium]
MVPTEVGWVGSRDEAVRKEIDRLLLAAPTRDLAAGWRLCESLGQAAAPMLWELLAAERSNLQRRLALLAGAVLAGGANEDRRLLEFLGQPKPMLEERCLAMLLIALGPPRSRPYPEFWDVANGGNRSPEQVMGIAVRLAAARLPGAAGSAPAVGVADPGLASAAAFAGAPIADSVVDALWNQKAPVRHAELFWRGALLGVVRPRADRPELPAWIERAQVCAAMTGSTQGPLRAAALAYLGRAGEFRGNTAPADWEDLAAAIVDLPSARDASAWLPALPPTRLLRPECLLVAFALGQPPEQVADGRVQWLVDPQVGRHAAIALAWRLAAGEVITNLPRGSEGLPEWAFVDWATGRDWALATALEDPTLQAAAVLCREGRLSLPAAKELFEATLWRWGSHPGWALWQQEALLVRDLLLVGSHQGGSKYLPHVRPERRFRAGGLGPDSPFYDVAVALFDHLATPRTAVPSGYGLR